MPEQPAPPPNASEPPKPALLAPGAGAPPAAPAPVPPPPAVFEPEPGTGKRGRPTTRRTLRYVLIEVGIVTAGVLIALGVDEMRTHFASQRLAEDTRERFRVELEANRDRALRKMAETERVYRAVQASPEAAGGQVRSGANVFMLLFDAAWVTAVQTEALPKLPPAEIATLSSTYSGQNRYMTLQEQEQERWQALGAFPEGALPPAGAEARALAVAQWRSHAQGLYQSTCRLVFRYDAALGRPYRDEEFQRCRRLDPARDSFRPAAGAPR